MLRRSLFEEAGLFRENYFMYAEDLELCYKIRQAGYTNYFIPGAPVIHFGGGSAEKRPSDVSVVMMRESLWRFMKNTEENLWFNLSRIYRDFGNRSFAPVDDSNASIVFRSERAILTWGFDFKAAVSSQP
jgi:GT2 family glycosyltransferase